MDSFPPLPKGISGRCGIISHSGIMRALIYMEFAYSQQSFHPEVFPTWLCFSIVENPRECWIPKIPKPRKTGPSPKAKLCDPRFGNAMSEVHKFHPAPGAALGMITGNRSRELQKILLAYAANKPKPIPTFQFHLFFFSFGLAAWYERNSQDLWSCHKKFLARWDFPPNSRHRNSFVWATNEFCPAFPFSSLPSWVAELRRDQTTWDENVTSVPLITGVTFLPRAFPLSEPCLETLEKQRDTTPQG